MNNGTAKSSATEARWQRVKRLFHAALQTPPDERAAYLQQACDGDPALQQEIERLLAHDRMAGDFLAEPAAADAAQALLCCTNKARRRKENKSALTGCCAKSDTAGWARFIWSNARMRNFKNRSPSNCSAPAWTARV
jgi:hypothetical protein